MMNIWYANPMGEQGGIFRRKNKIVRSPTVEPGSLYDCTGVYVFCASKSDASPSVLRFIRAPVDYSHKGHTAALYGLTDPDSMITRTSDWSLKSAWKNKDCSHVRFVNKNKPNGLDGDWGAMVHIDLPNPDVPIEDLTNELEAELVCAITAPIEFNESKVKLLRKGNTCSMKESSNSTRVMLPRVFPVFTEGDMPSSCDLELSSGDALSNLKRLATENCANPDTFSHSLHVLFTSKFFLFG